MFAHGRRQLLRASCEEVFRPDLRGKPVVVLVTTMAALLPGVLKPNGWV